MNWNCDVDGDGVPEDLALDDRSWVDFTAIMADGQADPCDQPGCGNSELRDRVEGENNGGVPCRSFIEIPACTVGDSGVRNVTWRAAGDEAGEIKFIPLYDPLQSPCEIDPNADGSCGGERYWVADVGCILVMGSYHLCPAGVYPPPSCPQNGPRVIHVQVSCDPLLCATDCGTTGGGIPGPGDIRAVSLIR